MANRFSVSPRSVETAVPKQLCQCLVEREKGARGISSRNASPVRPPISRGEPETSITFMVHLRWIDRGPNFRARSDVDFVRCLDVLVRGRMLQRRGVWTVFYDQFYLLHLERTHQPFSPAFQNNLQQVLALSWQNLLQVKFQPLTAVSADVRAVSA